MNRPVFPSSATIRVPEKLALAKGGWRQVELAVRYGVWTPREGPPILIDTGYGPRSCVASTRSALLKLYGHALRPRLRASDLLSARVAALGWPLHAVGLTILTHFHPDHIDGIRDLAGSRFLVSAREWDIVSRAGRAARTRHAIFEELIPDDFSSRVAFVEDLPQRSLPFGLGVGGDVLGDGSLLTAPLPGHSPGHFGLLWPKLDPPLLYAVDAQWLWRAIAEDRAPPLAERVVFHDRAAGRDSMARLRAFAAAGGEVVLCHDPSPRPTRLADPRE
jgi:glyoxylase-like metal-dependent hydrolase (beta-lactamase superfamily II)